MALARWIGLLLRALLIVAFVSVLLLPIAWNTLASETDWIVPGPVIAAWAMVLATTIVLGVLYLAWRLLLAVWRNPLGGWTIFGRTPSSRLVSLGLIALIAPRVVSNLIVAPINLLIEMTGKLPFQIVRFSAFVSSNPNYTPELLDLIIRFSIGAQELLSELARAIGNFMLGLNIAELILVLAAWALVSSVIDACAGTTDNSAPARGIAGRIASYVRGLDSHKRYGILLSCIFMVGAYFCIAAIVAIPWLQEDQASPTVTRESLENLLEQSLPQELAQTPAAEPKSLEDPMAGLRETLSAELSDTNSGFRFLLNNSIERAAQFRSTAMLREAQFPAEIASRIDHIRKNALVAFQVETVDYMTSQERGYFMRDITRITSQQYEDLRQALRQCRSRIADGNSQLASWGQSARSALPYMRSMQPQATGIFDAGVTALISQLDSILDTFRDACTTPRDYRTVYTPPEPGQGWGPFGALARWLLQTRSIALTLITGMLGFGLLGSAIATFVRTHATAPAHPSIGSEITRVAIRGVSAAIVIFLAAKGGLSILASAESEPNPYVLFFGCLVGAVFSEDVWVWAREKFLVSLNGDEERKDERGDDAVSRPSPEPKTDAQPEPAKQ